VSCISSLGKVRHTGPLSSPDPLSSGTDGFLTSLAPRRCPTAAPYQASVSPPVQQAPCLCPSDESCLRATLLAHWLCVFGSPTPPRQLFLTIALSHAVLPPRRVKAPDRPRSQNARPIKSDHPTQARVGHPGGDPCSALPRKEVIQPHLPVRLPCYDFTPVTSPTLDTCPLCCQRLARRLQVFPAPMV